MADVVEVESVELGVARDEIAEGREDPLTHARHGRIEVEPGGAHAIELAIGLREIELGIVEDRAPPSIDEDGLASELGEELRVATGREREHVHPRVHTHAPRVRVPDQQRQRIDGETTDLGRALEGGIGGVEGTPAAVDLHEEIRDPETHCAVEERRHARGIVEDADRSLGQDPEPAHRGRLRRGEHPCRRRRRARRLHRSIDRRRRPGSSSLRRLRGRLGGLAVRRRFAPQSLSRAGKLLGLAGETEGEAEQQHREHDEPSADVHRGPDPVALKGRAAQSGQTVPGQVEPLNGCAPERTFAGAAATIDSMNPEARMPGASRRRSAVRPRPSRTGRRPRCR